MKLAKGIATIGLSLLMVLQANSPALTAWAQTVQADDKAGVTTYNGETYDDEKSSSKVDTGATDSNASDTSKTEDSSADTSNENTSSDNDASNGSGSDADADQEQGLESAGSSDADDAPSDAADQPSEQSVAGLDTIDGLKAALGNNCTLTADGQKLATVTIPNGRADLMVLLSNAEASLYSEAAITTSGTGLFSLTNTCTYNGQDLTYQGLGSRSAPFEGTVQGDKTYQLNRPLFNYYSPQADATINLQFGKTQTTSLLADHIQGNNHKLSVCVAISNGAEIAAPLCGTVEGDLALRLTYQNATNGNYTGNTAVDVAGNAGLVAGKVDAGSKLVLESIDKFKPSDGTNQATTSVTSQDANAGLVLGELGDGATFEMCGLGTADATGGFRGIAPTGTISAANGCAGGLIGRIGDSATITVSANEVNLSKLTVAGIKAGGLAGGATNLKLSFADEGKIDPAATVGSTSSSYVGGLFGQVSFLGDYEIPDSGKIVFPANGFELKSSGSVGGLFGEITLNGTVKFARNDLKSVLSGGNGAGTNYGGLVGRLLSTKNEAGLVVDDAKITVSMSKDSLADYYGGLIGTQGKDNGGDNRVALRATGATTVELSDSSSSSPNKGFGGAVGCVCQDSTVELSGFALNTNGVKIAKPTSSNRYSGGVIGEMYPGAVLCLSGKTDLSNACYNDQECVGQIVGFQSSALIYATGSGQDGDDSGKGWTFSRPKSKVGIDDVANYGEIIRLNKDASNDGKQGLSHDLISIGSDHNAKILSGNAPYTTISSNDDFARVAIAWLTNGKFNGCDGLDSNQAWQDLTSANLMLANDIDLAGTGLIGFMRDSNVTSNGMAPQNAYAGTFDGGKHTITLAIGEPYGQRDGKNIESNDTKEGNGKIYRHNRLGLFAPASGNVKNLTIDGTMRFTAKAQIHAGGYAAKLESGSPELSGVVSNVAISCASSNENVAYVGGLYGVIGTNAKGLTFVSGAASGTTVKPGNMVKGRITVSDGAGHVVFGGAVGSIEGESSAVVTVSKNGLLISGSIGAEKVGSSTNNVPAGGFIGVIYGGKSKTVNLSGLSLSGLSLSAPSCNSTGGLLGYSWANADVTFNDGGLVASEGDKLGGVSSGTSVGQINSAGGLVYKASGKWQVNNGGIDLSGYTISDVRSDLGLLVCRGGANKEQIAGSDARTEGLYLEVTAEWSKACKLNSGIVSSSSDIAHYDEWVCSTVDTTGDSVSQNNVLAAGYNGVVSLKTTGDAVVMDGSERNTYVNRTTYGTSQPTNVNTRYYYNLDEIRADVDKASADNKIDTPQELMLWSVIKYADDTIKSYFYSKAGTDCVDDKNLTVLSGDLDLRGYSYYPVDVTDTDITIDNAIITFYNDKIEDAETTANNKSNKPTVASSQHLAMHAGLIRNFAKGAAHTLSVSNTTFKGSVGMMTGGTYNYGSCSGALICGDAYGSLSNTGEKNICSIELKDCTLSGLSIKNYSSSYAPLLINGMGSYTALTVDGITTKYTKGTKVATSLLGNLGGKNATQVTATFNHISIPAGKNDAIFSKASILNSFGYDAGAQGVGSATYTFTKDDRNKNEVTFGQEIDRNKDTEYSGKQLWYFDEDTYDTPDGLVTVDGKKANADNPQFGDYLPYVYSSKSTDGQPYNHEIKVNQRLQDLTKGCGTYTDPYVISKEATFETLASYVGDGVATDGWRITIAADQSKVCTRRSKTSGSSGNEVTYVYSAGDGNWHKGSIRGEALPNSVMHRYVQSCYIDINDTDASHEKADRKLEVSTSKFTGLGTEDNPFRGVITSTNGTKLVINNDTSTFSGLIKYSYGCVVKNLAIEYTGNSDTVEHASPTNAIPGSFFGGVFGLILGGDNIIDGVNISKSGSFAVSASGDKPQIVPIGGYVGAIAGGGVIFRGSMDVSWYDGNESNYYDNPVIGRVLDGYAFTEGDKCSVGDNTVNGKTANYKLVKLDPNDKGTVTTGELHNSRVDNDNTATTTTVSNAKGLLLLSAIINSGAAAGPLDMASPADGIKWAGTFNGTNAYAGKTEQSETSYRFGNGGYGKARNATYGNIGNPDASSSDFDKSKIDDQKAPGLTSNLYPHQSGFEWDSVNAPYLVSTYCSNKHTLYICGAGYSSFDLQLKKGGGFNMKDYGNAYRGLSGCYYTNALKDDVNKPGANGARSNYARDRAIPWVAHIDGGGNALKVDMQVNEYANDDFNSVGVGALFSYALFTGFQVSETTKAHNGLYIENLTVSSSTISHKLSDNSKAASTWGVGGIAGIALVENDIDNAPVKISNVALRDKDSVVGPSTAGGFFGNAGVYGRFDPNGTTDETLKYPIAPDSVAHGKGIAFEFDNCSYNGLTLTGGQHTGGFVGQIARSVGKLWNKASVTDSSLILGKDSNLKLNIQNKIPGQTYYLGGVFGAVNAPLEISGDHAVATLQDVSMTSSNELSGLGGFIGNVGGTFVAKGLSFKTAKADTGGNTVLQHASKKIGGILGASSGEAKLSFTDCTVQNVQMKNSEGAGGIVGDIQSSTVEGSDIKVEDVTFTGSDTGGFVGLGNGNNVKVKNARFVRNSFSKQKATWGSLPNQSGGFSGDTKGTFRLSNILIDSCVFNDPNGQGVVAGNARAVDGDSAHIYIAGLEVRKPTGNDASKFPSKLFNTEQQGDTAQKNVNNGSFVSFANYNGKAVSSNGPLYNDAVSDSATDGTNDPYVTTSPVATDQAQLAGDDSSTGGYLFGDGANVGIAQSIVDDSKSGSADASSDIYAYDNTAGTDRETGDRKKATALSGASASTLAANNTDLKTSDGKSEIKVPALNVLQINGGSTGAIERYLNIVTNGGYSDAVANNDESNKLVTATAKAYKVSDNGELVPTDDAANVSVRNNGSSKMAFDVSSQFDNGKGTFTLVTLTFKAEEMAGEGMEHKVMVPVVVRRLLETTMTATFVDGTPYYESAYDYGKDENGDPKDAKVRLLTDYGTSSTALVTFHYNYNNKDHDEESKGRSEYGWDSYLAAGGDMSRVSRSIIFNNNSSRQLPAGTLFTLVDKDNDGCVYTYTLDHDGNVLDLSEFKKPGSDKEGYGKWMSELMGVEATSDDSGNWVKIDTKKGESISDAKARIKTKDGYDYYRPVSSGSGKYTLTCEKDDEGKEIAPKEDFYLTVFIPKDKAPSYNINGNLDANLSCGTVNFDTINHALRSNGAVDSQSGTASTYNFMGGYSQSLADNSSDKPRSPMEPSATSDGAGRDLAMDVVDTVSFSSDQVYDSGDPLYFRLESSLSNFKNDSFSGGSSFPVGCSGSIDFYVYTEKDGARTYYGPSGTNGLSAASDRSAAFSKTWTSDGSTMKIDVDRDLRSVREASKSTGYKFFIEAKGNIHLSEEAYKVAITSAQKDANGEVSAYTKLNYRVTLANTQAGLNTSTLVRSNDGDVRYYREDKDGARISLTANKTDQLGININDLNSAADGNIGATAVYDLTRTSNASDAIGKIRSVRYTLTLEKRTGTDGSYVQVSNPTDYISVSSKELGDGKASAADGSASFVWTDSSLKTKDPESQKYKLSLDIKVNTAIREFANYRVRITAQAYDASGSEISSLKPWNNNNVGSDGEGAHSDYITYTLTRVNLKGISGSTTN